MLINSNPDLSSEVSSAPPTGVSESMLSEWDTDEMPEPETMTSVVTGMEVSSTLVDKQKMKKQARVKKLMKAMRKSEQVDLCFVVDCTGSMQPWIDSVKSGITDLYDAMYRKYDGCDLRVAFVRYTDYDQPEGSRTTWIDFTRSTSDFKTFVSGIRATGGEDPAEDVMGGLNVALNTLSWRPENITKVLIHIADCPCHGRKYHDGIGDDHPKGDPNHIHPHDMMELVARQEIQYWFGYICKDLTDKMITIFNELLKETSGHKLMISQFEAVNPAKVVNRVFDSVVHSINATTMTLTGRRCPIRSYSIDKSNPNWGTLKEHLATYLSMTPIPEETEDEEGTIASRPRTATLLVADRPFDEGALSIVFHCRDAVTGKRYVMKQSKREGKEFNSRSYYEDVVLRQKKAARYAKKFNQEKPRGVRSVQFASVQVLQVERNGKNELGLIEPLLEGKYEKFNTNNGWVSKSPYSATLQAFSHYTHEQSRKKLVIVDLQGIAFEHELILTDPAIQHMDDSKFGPTNFGQVGIWKFFKSHACNDICNTMGLTPYKHRDSSVAATL